MRKLFLSAAFLACMFQMPVSAHSQGMSLEQAMCPIEKLGDADGEALSKAFVTLDDNTSFDAEMDKLQDAINVCAGELNWTKADSQFSLDFSLAIVAGVATEEKLASFDIVASDYETGLDDGGPTDWQKLADDPENSPVMQAALDKLIAEKGDSATEEVSGYLGAYLVSAAKSRLLALKLIENGGTDF
jgi:hypothetical protein